MSKSVNVDFVTRQIEVDTDGKEHFISAAMAAKDAEASMLNAQNAANTAEKIATDLGLVDEAVQTAVSSAEQASNSATTASNKADIATAKADVATTKASEASTSADTATSKADAASNSAANAAQSYANADAVATQLTEYLATKESLTAPAVDKTLLIEGAAADSKVVGELKSDLDKQIGVQKLSGYFNLAKLPNATIHKGKKISQFNTETKEPVLVDDELYTTVIMPINGDYGNYNMLIGTNYPSSGIAMMRYKANVSASVISYSELPNLDSNVHWDATYDGNTNTLTYLTDKIASVSANTHYAFCFYNTEPIVYPENFPDIDSKILQLSKIIGIEQLTEDLQAAINNVSGIANIDVSLPDVIYSVIGHENNIYFWNILKCSNINDYTIRVGGANWGSGIKNLGDRVWMKPTSAKTQGLSFKVYKNNQLLKEKTTTIKMIADTQPSGIKVIFIGDSMVENGYSIAELKNMLSDNITFYGTRQGGQKDSSDTWRTVYHEGRSSWSSGEYLSSQTYNSVTNAFYNPDTSAFDFNYYMTNNPSFSDVTDVILQLGNNDVDRLTKEQYVSNMQTLVDNIKSYNSNINVYVCIPSSPVNDGYAFGVRNYTDINYYKDKIFDYGKALMEQIQNANIIPIYLNLDNYNDFPKTTVARSDRNPETYEVCNDNVHPSKYGFYKFADTFYCSILAKYNN